MPFDFAALDLETYRQGLISRYAALQPASFQPALDQTLLQKFFIAPNVLGPRDDQPDRQTIAPALDVLKDPEYPRLVIQGAAGSGKSTLLRYLVLEWASQPAEQLSDHPIPLLINLPEYAGDTSKPRSLLGYLERVASPLSESVLHDLLLRGQAWCLLDGIDEIPGAILRHEIAREIQNLVRQYPLARIVVTSRDFYHGHHLLPKDTFKYFVLEPLNSEQTEDFIDRWYDTVCAGGQCDPREQEQLKKFIAESPDIRRWARNPLQLTLLTLLNRLRDRPRNRVRLYQHSLEWLMGSSLNQSDEHELPHPIFRDFLLAFRITRTTNLVVEEKLLEIFSTGWQDEAQHECLRFIVGQLDLADRTELASQLMESLLLEADPLNAVPVFLCAQCLSEVQDRSRYLLLDRRLREAVQALIDFELPFYCELWNSRDARRTEVRLRAVTTAAEVWPDEETKIWLHTLIRERKYFGIQDEALWALVREWKNDPATFSLLLERRNDQAIRVLAFYWKNEPQALSLLKELAKYSEEKPIRWVAVEELARGWDEGEVIVPWLQELVENVLSREVSRGGDSKALVKLLGRYAPDEVKTLLLLREIIRRNESLHASHTRIEAIRTMARGYRNSPETLVLLQHYLEEPEYYFSQPDVIHELVCGWKDDPATLPLLQQTVQNGRESNARVALEELVLWWKGSAITSQWLQDYVQKSENGDLRSTAVILLARHWRYDPATLPWLKAQVQHNADSSIRSAALWALAEGWKHDPETFSLLQTHALQLRNGDDLKSRIENSRILHALVENWKERPETFDVIRQCVCQGRGGMLAVKVLAYEWPGEPDTLPLLQERLRTDSDSEVRFSVIRALARNWRDDEQTMPLIRHHARHDSDKAVREIAVNELAYGWRNAPETASLIMEIVLREEERYVRDSAVRALKWLWKNDDAVQQWLMEHQLVS